MSSLPLKRNNYVVISRFTGYSRPKPTVIYINHKVDIYRDKHHRLFNGRYIYAYWVLVDEQSKSIKFGCGCKQVSVQKSRSKVQNVYPDLNKT